MLNFLDENAITINTSNGFETFVIELSSLKEESNKAISLLNDLLKSPNYSEDTLSKLKTLMVGSLKRKREWLWLCFTKSIKIYSFKNTALENQVQEQLNLFLKFN